VVTDTPLYVADEILRRDLAGNIAAPMDWADFLVWKTGGTLKPLVHSHVHLTEIGTWKDYESIFRGDEVWLHMLQNHQMQYLLVPRQRFANLAKLVLLEDRNGSGRVRIIYKDQRCLLAEVLPPRAQDDSAPSAARPPGDNNLFAPPTTSPEGTTGD
jgi:hypothetical protein